MKIWVSLCVLFLLFCISVSAQEPPVLTPQAYLPIVARGDGFLPSPHRVKAALSREINVSCEKVESYGAEWVSSWWPNCGMCGNLPMKPMIRDLGQLEQIKAGEINLATCPWPIQSLNEPDNSACDAGACITLEEAVIAHREIEELFPDKEITSPAFLPGWADADYSFLDWVDASCAYYEVCPRFEIVAMHPYGTSVMGWQASFATTSAEYDNLLLSLEARGYTKLRVWLTEFGWYEWEVHTQTVQEHAKNYLQAWLNKCDNDSRCEYINWYSITTDYGWVTPLEINGIPTLPGELWLSQFVP